MEFNEFIIMRHSYDDHSYIDGKNDTSLTKKGIDIANDAAKEIMHYLDNRNIIVRYSSKKRAQETAFIICENLAKHGMSFCNVEDTNLNELFQGKLNFGNMLHEQKVDFLQSCWDDFEECRQNGDLEHCFGEYKSRDIVLGNGENHKEWSRRMGNAVLSIIDDIEKNNQVIAVTHRGATFEIQNIIKMANMEMDFQDVEKYKTVWMKYCQDYLLRVNNLKNARERVQTYIQERSM